MPLVIRGIVLSVKVGVGALLGKYAAARFN
jgi:hypothetical protein